MDLGTQIINKGCYKPMKNNIKLKDLDNKLFYKISTRWGRYFIKGYPKLVDYKKFDINKPVGYEWKNLDILLKDKDVISLLEELNAIE